MIIAGILFLIGILIGVSRSPLNLLLASAALAAVMIVLWLALGSFSAFSVLILFGYLAALQSGYILGVYLVTKDDP